MYNVIGHIYEIDHKNDIVLHGWKKLHGWTFTTWINLILKYEIEHKGKPNTYVDKYDIYMVTKWWNFTNIVDIAFIGE